MTAADDLLDYAAARPDGFTWNEAAHDLDLTQRGVHRAVREVRQYLAGSHDPRVLVWNYYGGYCLVTGWTEQAEWQDGRALSLESQMATVEASARAALLTTKASTLEGRRARVMVKLLGRLLEDLADLRAAP